MPLEKEDSGCACQKASEIFCFSSQSTGQIEMSHFVVSILSPIALFRFAPTSSWTEKKKKKKKEKRINHTNMLVHVCLAHMVHNDTMRN